MNYDSYSTSLSTDANRLGNIAGDINGINFSNNWKGLAADEILVSLSDEVEKIGVLKGQLEVFSTALNMTKQLADLDSKIARLKNQLASLDPNDEDDDSAIDSLTAEIARLTNERIKLKNKIISILTSITGVTGADSTSNINTVPAGELSYDDAVVLAKKLQVPVEYILSLHLHEGYKIGDRLIPEGITPDVIHYAGKNGFPILIDSIKKLGNKYTADAPERSTYFIKNADNFSAVNGGSEYNIKGWPITFGETEGRDIYWTYYGPISQGNELNRPAAPIQCTATDLFPCDDGHYRDKDGYIVIAGCPYVNQFYDGVHVDYEANGGMNYEDMFVVTPFGLGRFYDNGGVLVSEGIECDFYLNDGYESNNIATTEYGKRLRESAVEGYESLNLYWNQMIH